MNRTLALLAALALSFTACGDEEPTDTTDTADTGTTEADADDDTTVDVPSTHVATTYRIINIDIDEPASMGTILGALMNGDIRSKKLNVLVDFRAFSGDTGDVTFEMTGNGGATTDTVGEYTWHEMVDVANIAYAPATMDANGLFENTETMSLDFPGIQPNTDPIEIFIIPIKDLSLSGEVFVEDGELLMDAHLEGAILLEDAEGIELRMSPTAEPQTLSELLSSVEMDYPEAGDAATGWRMSGQILAEPVILVP